MSRGLWFAMSARTRRSLTLLWTALFLCSLAMQYVHLAVPAPTLAAHDEGIFELDGDALDSAAAGADWQNGAEGSLDQFFVGIAAEGSANDDSYFTTGGSKDENDVSAWKITTNSVPDKNELLNAYAAVYEQGGDTWVYFGADRFDNDGTAQIGFWFFQDEVGISGGDFFGEHVDGDVLILSEYTNGGVVSLICAYTWDGSGGGDNVDPAGGCDPATDGSNLDLVAAGVECDVADGTLEICAVTNDAVASGVTDGGNPVEDDDPAEVVILAFGLLIDKANDAPLESLELPVGVTYVNGSATSDAQFTFVSFNAATRTLTWTAPSVTIDGTLSYQATVDVGAAELAQPLINVALIDSAQTEPDEDDSDVFVPTEPEAATGTPRVTLPPTDVIGGSDTVGNAGFSLMLILLALGGLVLAIGFVTPVPASVRERDRRR